MFAEVTENDFEFGKVYSQVRVDTLRGKLLHHIVRVSDESSASGWREYGFGHQLNEKCITCCTWTDDEFEGLAGQS